MNELNNDSPFLPERMKIKKVEKLGAMIKREFVIYVRNLKQALNHGLVLKKEHEDSLNLIKNLGKMKRTQILINKTA